ncbi:MAG: permease-like cell division protein FtsX [Clostridiales Family XIII bacterium]|jgi:cell division transport system permease protein|nr:permease-like cell division protein FtsX [Clostridiales Family XIII bacterium]
MNSGFVLSIRQAFSQIGRNAAMTLATLFSISAILMILGFFFIVLVNINNISEGAKENFNTIEVKLLDETDKATADAMMDELRNMEGVRSVAFRTKDENLENWKEKWGDAADMLDRLKANPLPNSIIVEIDDLSKAEDTVRAAEAMTGTDTISYAQKTVDKLINFTGLVRVAALILIAVLLIISIVVVSNTIKLTVLAREREITIMKYVGATNWFIRGPFLLEGIIIGIVAAIVSGGLISLAYHYIVQNFGVNIALIISIGFVPEKHLLPNLAVIFLAIGMSIGACGSIISMRRFLDT